MLMAELSRRSGVPVATIKYYLREGLLPSGVATSATRAQYNEVHLRRLRLIRALVEIGEVPVTAIRKILSVVDDQGTGLHEMLGAVQYQLGPHLATAADDDSDWQAASQEVDDLIASLGWTVSSAASARTLLTLTLAALRRMGTAPPGPGLRAYAEAMAGLAAAEVASLAASDTARQAAGRDPGPSPGSVPNSSPELAAASGDARVALAESAVLGMVLYERVIVALRRLAQEDASARLFG